MSLIRLRRTFSMHRRLADGTTTVYILAPSYEHAEQYARQWCAERPRDRRLVDAVYLNDPRFLSSSRRLGGADRVVQLVGAHLHPRHDELRSYLEHMAARSGRKLGIDLA